MRIEELWQKSFEERPTVERLLPTHNREFTHKSYVELNTRYYYHV
jgi:hypothetical protein